MTLRFPESPQPGFIYSFGGNQWIWNGSAWETYVQPFNYVDTVNGLSGTILIEGIGDIGISQVGQSIVVSLNEAGIAEDLPRATTGSPGIASFDDNTLTVTATGHVAVKTGIVASRIVVLEESPYYGMGNTGALPNLDGYKLVNVDAKFLDGKSTGINAGQVLVLGESILYGPGATGALPALDGSALTGVDAKYLQGRTPREITDGGVF
jgi:hypothetical protein